MIQFCNKKHCSRNWDNNVVFALKTLRTRYITGEASLFIRNDNVALFKITFFVFLICILVNNKNKYLLMFSPGLVIVKKNFVLFWHWIVWMDSWKKKQILIYDNKDDKAKFCLIILISFNENTQFVKKKVGQEDGRFD